MKRWLVGLAAAACATTAQAQVYGAPGTGGFGGGAGGGGNPAAGLGGAFAPNFYNRTQQPLSPYLNLLNGGNPAVNYFYGARPGLNPGVSGLGGGFGGAGGLAPPGFGNRYYLQPPADFDDLPSQPLEANRRLNVLPSAGHPVVFGNGPGLGGVARGLGRGGQAGLQQQAARGGTAPPPPRR